MEEKKKDISLNYWKQELIKLQNEKEKQQQKAILFLQVSEGNRAVNLKGSQE